MDDYPFPEPFGPVYARPPGADCPDCECCTKALCDKAREAEHWIFRSCAFHSGSPELVRGCPCPNRNAAPNETTR